MARLIPVEFLTPIFSKIAFIRHLSFPVTFNTFNTFSKSED